MKRNYRPRQVQVPATRRRREGRVSPSAQAACLSEDPREGPGVCVCCVCVCVRITEGVASDIQQATIISNTAARAHKIFTSMKANFLFKSSFLFSPLDQSEGLSRPCGVRIVSSRAEAVVFGTRKFFTLLTET